MVTKMDDEDWDRYFAGFIDADGMITLLKHKRNTKKGFNFVPCIGMFNRNKRVIEKAKDIYGFRGNIYTREKNGWFSCYIFYCENQSLIVGCLERLIPYLQIKYEQAEILISFIKKREHEPQYLNTDYSLYNRMRWLNQKGQHKRKYYID